MEDSQAISFEDSLVEPQTSEGVSTPTSDTISFVDQERAVPYTEEDKHERAAMAHYALQEQSPGVPEIVNTLTEGREQALRAQAAMHLDIQNQKQTLETVKKIAGRKGGPLTVDETNQLVEMLSQPPTNPGTVWEDMWAHNYTKELVMHPKNKVMRDGAEASLEKTLAMSGYMDTLVARRNAVISLRQEMQGRYDSLPAVSFSAPGFGYVGSWVQSFIPLLSQYRRFDAVPGSKEVTSSILPGSNLSEQVSFTYLLPRDKFLPTVRTVVEELYRKNPHDAMAFLDAMISRTTDSTELENLFGVADVATVIPVGWLARGGKAAADATKKVLSKAPVQVTEEAAEALKGRLLTPEEVERLKVGAAVVKGTGEAARTITIARTMTPEELRKAADGLGIPYPTSPTLPEQNLSAAISGAPRGTGEITGFKSGEQTFRANSSTVYVSAEDAARLQSPEGQRRIWMTKSGNLSVSTRTDRGWRVSDVVDVPVKTEPEQGLTPVFLGSSRNSMGTRYFDQARFGDEVTELERRTDTVTEPRLMHPREIQTAREGIQRNFTPDEIAQMQDRMMGVRALLATGVSALKEAPTISGPKADTAGVLTRLGRIPEAAELGAMERLRNTINKVDKFQESESLGKQILSIFHPNAFWENSSALSRELASRYAEAAILQSDKLLNGLLGMRTARLTEHDMRAAIQATKDKAAKEFSHVNDTVLDVRYIDDYSPSTNMHTVDVVIGKKGAEAFDTFESANNTAIEMGITGQYFIKPEGQGFFIHVPKHVNEADPLLKNTFIPTNNVTPKFWGNVFIGAIRSADDTTSPFQNAARKVATHAPQELKNIILEEVKTIRLSNKEKKDLKTLLEQNRLDFDKNGRRGAWYDTAADLEKAYMDRIGGIPSADFIKAYNTYTRIHDYDGLMRELTWFGQKTRWGVQNVSIKVFDDAGRLVDSPTSFEGRIVEDFQRTKRDQGIYVIDTEGKSGKYKWISDYDLNKGDFKTYLDSKLEKGYQIVQLFSPLKKPLAEATGNSGEIYYVITNTATLKRPMWGDNIEWRPGGHHVYLHPHFIKQPILNVDGKGQLVHYGDRTFRAGGSTEAETRVIAEKYDVARKLLKDGNDAALDAYLRANLPESIDDFKKLFTGPNALSKDEPIVYAYHATDSFQSNPKLYDDPRYATLKDYPMDSGNPEAALNKKFLAERADQPLMAVRQSKDASGGIQFHLEQAPMIDPFITINRAIGQAVRSRFMDDIKTLAAESFGKEFGKYIRGFTQQQIDANPLYFLYHGSIDESAPAPIKAAFKATQRNVKNFVGMKSELGRDIDWVESKVLNGLYHSLGPETAGKIIDNSFVQGALIPTLKDPTRFMRSVAFHSKLGFFNPIQLFVQAQALSNVLALAGPNNAARGFAAASISRALRHTEEPAIIERHAKIAAKIGGWTKEEYIEAVHAWKASGITRVAGETAWRDDFFDPKLFQSGIGRWLDKGTMFFAMGERISRDTAFFTAFREWKMANPGKKLDQFSSMELMNRVDTLNVNMTRASNSMLQEGIFSVPTQFLTFNQRLMEQMLGRRIPWKQKAQAMLTFSTLYGVPIGTTTGLGFYPAYDDIKTYALEKNIKVSEGFYHAFHEGLMSLIFEGVTGKKTDLAKRWGPGGSNIMEQIFSGEKHVVDLFLGPSGGVMKDTVKSFYPFLAHIKSSFDPAEEQYKLTPEDFMKPFQNITTASNAIKYAYVLNVGKYYANNGTYIGDMTGFEGFLNATLGLTPSKFQDDILKQKSLRAAHQLQDLAEKDMMKEYRNMLSAALEGDYEKMEKHRRNAFVIGKGADMLPDDFARALAKSGRGFESRHDQVNEAWRLRDPRASAYPDRLNSIGTNQ